MEFAVPLSPRAREKEPMDRPAVVSLSRDRFMIWDGDVRLELHGELQVFRGLHDVVLAALRESGPDGQTYEFVSPEPLVPNASNADAGCWMYSYVENHLYAVRIGSRQISCLKLACDGGVATVRHAADASEALSAVGVSVPGREALRRWELPASIRECVSEELHSGEWVEPHFGALPCLLHAAESDAHGHRVGLRARYLTPGHRSTVPGMLAVPVATLLRGTNEFDRNWFALLGSARADRARRRGCVFVSTFGRFFAWPDASGAWFVLDILDLQPSDECAIDQAGRVGTIVQISGRQDVLGLAWSPCEEWILLTLSDGTIQLLKCNCREIFGHGDRPRFAPRVRTGVRPVPRWEWLLPAVLDGCDPPVEYLRLVWDNLAGVFKFEDDAKRNAERQRSSWRRRWGYVKADDDDEDDATKNADRKRGHTSQVTTGDIEQMLLRFGEPDLQQAVKQMFDVSIEDTEGVARRLHDICGANPNPCVRCAEELVATADEMGDGLDETREMAAKVRRCLARVADRSATPYELLVASGRLFRVWRDESHRSWKADRWWNDAIEAFVEKCSDAGDLGQESPTRGEAIAVVGTLLSLLSSPDPSARSPSAIMAALGHVYRPVEFASPPVVSAGPGVDTGEFAMPKCVRVRWQSESQFEGVAPASAKGGVWVGDLREVPDGLGQRFSVCKGRRPARGPRGLGALADSGFERPIASTDWSPDGVRIRGHLVEIRSGEEAIARYAHSKNLKGYTINPHDRSLVALIDESSELVILRLHP
jgi:hypothetical protein